MITAIVTSDNHLGVYYARLKPERLEQRRKRLQEGFAQVVDAAIARRVDLFLHAGDLFDRPDPRNADRCFVARQIQRLREADIPFFAIAGNHDSPRSLGYDGGTLPQEEMNALGAIHLFRKTDALESKTLHIKGQRVCVWGMSSNFNLPDDGCPLEGIAERHERGGDCDLVLLHYSVEGWTPPFAKEPCLSRANLKRLQTDAICVGHLHARQETRLPNGAILLNPGATEHIHFGEEKLECGYWLLHCEPGSTETEYVPIRTQPMQTVEWELARQAGDCAAQGNTGGNGEEALMPGLVARLESISRPDQLLRVRLKGEISREQFQQLDLNELQARGNALNFSCRLETEGLVVYDPRDGITIYGGSFDVPEEINLVAREFASLYGDNPAEQDICHRAEQELTAAYARLTGGQG